MPRAAVLSEPSSGPPGIVIDNGSDTIRAGFAGQELPSATLPSSGLAGAGDTRPIVGGIVRCWDTMEAYWDHIFTHQLKIDTAQCNLFVTSQLFDPKDNREHLMQTLFETFAAPGVYTSPSCVLELYAAGRENGVVLGCGAACSYAVLVHEGLPDPRTQLRSDVAGDALTAWTAEILQKAGGQGVTEAVARKAKESLALVAVDGEGTPPSEAAASTYELPDGRKLSVSPAQVP